MKLLCFVSLTFWFSLSFSCTEYPGIICLCGPCYFRNESIGQTASIALSKNCLHNSSFATPVSIPVSVLNANSRTPTETLNFQNINTDPASPTGPGDHCLHMSYQLSHSCRLLRHPKSKKNMELPTLK